ncbi:LemA family protein [Ottowia sp. GY511]|uniref:LemA family protein n=1 Tax=Ottowia flava TaxID=2675430 RepID=A0ABW4KT34_9BURK|nr:LemA family protein [Ottowia sp. GY511]TXK31065.1 LemA family protein [Ottowia sp. GY511]
MSSSSVWVAVVVAVVFFWAVGAYNRLVRLRTSVRASFAALDEQLMRQLVLVQASMPEAFRGGAKTLPGELQDIVTAAWTRLQAASDQFGAALAQARRMNMDVASMASLVMAHEALRAAWTAALAEAVPPEAVPSAERLQERWLRVLHQAMPLRAAFNDAVAQYNEAIHTFPAWLIAKAFRFLPAGPVSRLTEAR